MMTLIVLGCIFAAVALVLGLIFMPRTVALLFGFQIAMPYFVILRNLCGEYSGILVPIIIAYFLCLGICCGNEIINIRKKYFNK